MSSLPNAFREAPIAAWSESKTVVFPTLLGPTNTVSSLIVSSTFFNDLKHETLRQAIVTPLGMYVALGKASLSPN
jgi:hypothetical protein